MTEPSKPPARPLLRVEGLTVEFRTEHGPVEAAREVGFTVHSGETFGLVGESGSGKTVTSLAVLGMVGAPAGRTAAGSVRLDGRELRGLPPRELRKIRGNEIGMIFQEARRSLDPAFTVGDQIAETMRAHLGISRRDARARAVEMLELVGIPRARRRVHEYPHQFSGGMAQRVMLAIALCCSPKLLIADEPTTALDVTAQARVLELIRDLQDELGLAVLFISHDLGVIAQMCDRVAVMYAGQIVETGSVDDVLNWPRHPYTASLMAALPRLRGPRFRSVSLPGSPPDLTDPPPGCRFAPRCPIAADVCHETSPTMATGSAQGDGWPARCHFAGDPRLRQLTEVVS